MDNKCQYLLLILVASYCIGNVTPETTTAKNITNPGCDIALVENCNAVYNAAIKGGKKGDDHIICPASKMFEQCMINANCWNVFQERSSKDHDESNNVKCGCYELLAAECKQTFDVVLHGDSKNNSGVVCPASATFESCMKDAECWDSTNASILCDSLETLDCECNINAITTTEKNTMNSGCMSTTADACLKVYTTAITTSFKGDDHIICPAFTKFEQCMIKAKCWDAVEIKRFKNNHSINRVKCCIKTLKDECHDVYNAVVKRGFKGDDHIMCPASLTFEKCMINANCWNAIEERSLKDNHETNKVNCGCYDLLEAECYHTYDLVLKQDNVTKRTTMCPAVRTFESCMREAECWDSSEKKMTCDALDANNIVDCKCSGMKMMINVGVILITSVFTIEKIDI